jgi:chromate transporter
MLDDALGTPIWMLCIYLLAISMMAIGGGVIVLAPDIHRYVVETHHWMSSEQYTAYFTLAQAAPGPNLLFVTLVGWHIGGLLGAIGATVAVIVPPSLLTIVVMRLVSGTSNKTAGHRNQGRWGRALRVGLEPISVGLMLSMAWLMVRTADTGIGTVVLTVLTVVVFMKTRINPIWLIAIGAIVGLIGWA